MIKSKYKICSGIGIAKGYGCGNPALKRIYGLGISCCYAHWLYNSLEGKKKIEKARISAKKKVVIQGKKETAKQKIELLSIDGYRKKYIQPIINEIARLIDYGQPCIATGHFSGKMNGGHFISTGSNRTITFNLHNIHIQSYHSNCKNGGDNLKYREGIKIVYGQEYLDRLENLQSIQAIHLSKNDLIEIKNKALKIRNELKSNLTIRNPEERINLRDKINKRLGIY